MNHPPDVYIGYSFDYWRVDTTVSTLGFMLMDVQKRESLLVLMGDICKALEIAGITSYRIVIDKES